jgi:glycosyltransferase involved in cell wall biosynthesis
MPQTENAPSTSPPSDNPPQLDQTGVHLIGDFGGRTALCQSGRDIVEVVGQLGIPVQVLDLPISPDRMAKSGRVELADGVYQKPVSPLSVINWNGDSYHMLVRDLPHELFKDRRIIGIWYWETEELPDSHAKGYDLVDEIWVTSQYVADCLSKSSPVPVKKMPHLIHPIKPPVPLHLPEALQNGRFMFYFSFDFRSVSKRKNPEAVCKAFVRAFPQPTPDGPVCVIKSVAGRSHHKLEHLKLVALYRHRPDIIFMDGYVSVEERDSLMARCDCYVSLHRAEGLGLTLMEAMSLGKPCIGTAYSGNVDFMTEENSWLIPYEKVNVGPGAWPFPPNHQWADPSVKSAAEAMKQAVNEPDTVRKKGEAARRDILRDNGMESVSHRMHQLLVEAVNGPVREKPMLKPGRVSAQHSEDNASASGAPSGRAVAYQILRDSATHEGKARDQFKKLKSRHLHPEAAQCLKELLEAVKLQRKAQAEILRDLGDLKRRLHGYHGATLDNLVRDNQLTMDLLEATLSEPNDSDDDKETDI